MGRKISLLLLLITGLAAASASGQGTDTGTTRTAWDLSFYDGIMAAGYVDGGGFLNFTGPNIHLTVGHAKFIAGMLPSLRFKEDHSEPRNSVVTPNLGMGVTFCYRFFALQIPLYYNAKTATRNGSWKIGLGIGLRLNEFNQRK